MEKRLEILDLPQEVRDLITDCELTGRKTFFQRSGRPVVALISHDEYLAQRETLSLIQEPSLRDSIVTGENGMARGAMLECEDLGLARSERLRFAESVENEWKNLSDDERGTMTAALQRIDDDPIAGAPLFEPLRGLWSYRAEWLRVIYRLLPEARFVAILHIGRAPAEPQR